MCLVQGSLKLQLMETVHWTHIAAGAGQIAAQTDLQRLPHTPSTILSSWGQVLSLTCTTPTPWLAEKQARCSAEANAVLPMHMLPNGQLITPVMKDRLTLHSMCPAGSETQWCLTALIGRKHKYNPLSEMIVAHMPTDCAEYQHHCSPNPNPNPCGKGFHYLALPGIQWHLDSL